MKKSELRKIIKEEISKAFEGMEEPYVLLRVNSKNYGPMNNKLYSMGVNYEQISDDGIKVYTSKIDSNTLDSITNHPFVSSFKIIKEEISKELKEGALMDQGGWDYNLMDQIEDKVEELNSIIGKYDNEEIINLINEIIRDLEQLKNEK